MYPSVGHWKPINQPVSRNSHSAQAYYNLFENSYITVLEELNVTYSQSSTAT